MSRPRRFRFTAGSRPGRYVVASVAVSRVDPQPYLHVGVVQRRARDEWRAITSAGLLPGTFTTRGAAAAALWAHWNG